MRSNELRHRRKAPPILRALASQMLHGGAFCLTADKAAGLSALVEGSGSAYRELIGTLRSGITFLALHASAPGDIETIVVPRAQFCTDAREAGTPGDRRSADADERVAASAAERRQ